MPGYARESNHCGIAASTSPNHGNAFIYTPLFALPAKVVLHSGMKIGFVEIVEPRAHGVIGDNVGREAGKGVLQVNRRSCVLVRTDPIDELVHEALYKRFLLPNASG